nr:MAG TPA: hypothetical protein [Caudoviricetes sp.]
MRGGHERQDVVRLRAQREIKGLLQSPTKNRR